MKTNIKTVMKYVFSFTLVCMLLTAGGCSHDTEVVKPDAEVENDTGQVETRAEAPWEKVRYDYSYLTLGKVEEANQYLQNQKLSLEDLKQLHEIGNIVFGDAISKLMKNFKDRKLDILKKDLFVGENSRGQIYSLLIEDFHEDKRYLLKTFNSTPNIQIMVNHIGERKEWLFVPIRVYFPAPKEFANDPSYDENGGNDTRWRYYVLQVKKSENNSEKWEIAYGGQVVNRGIDGEILHNEWFVWLNSDDNFSADGWGEVSPMKNDRWNYYIGVSDCPDSFSEIECKSFKNRKTTGLYDRHAAASYAYNHAENYNPDYHAFINPGNDCANFVSQCLKAGGLPTNNIWGLIPNKYPYYGTDTWVGANPLYKYLRDNHGYSVSRKDLIDAYDGKKDCDLEWGDVLAMNKPNQVIIADNIWKTHVMIISHSYQHKTAYYEAPPRYKVCGHTNNRLDVDLIKLPGGRNYVKNHIMGVHVTYGLA